MEPHNIENQYSLTKILIIYLLAALPMAILGWVLNPIVAPLTELPDNVSFGITRIFLFTLGLIWLFLLSMIIIYLEYGTININIIKTRLWLQKPIEPKTNEPKSKLFLLLIPFGILVIVLELIFSPIQNFLIDFFHIDNKYLPESLLTSGTTDFFKGAWWFLALIIIFAVFNTVFGEEFLFRGILLPKMEGKFGRYDWVANGILMGSYHLHQPWGIPLAIVESVFCFSYTSRKYRSIWFGIVLHSLQSILLIVIITFLVLGLA